MKKDKNDASKENFIELDKDQFKKKSNLKRNLILIILLISLSFILFYFRNYLYELNFFSNKKKELEVETATFQSDLNKKNAFDQEVLNFLKIEIKKLSHEIEDNNFKISELNSEVLELRKKNKGLEILQKTNTNFVNNEKSLILYNLLNIKNKFKLRKDLDKELELLSLRIEDNLEIKMLLTNFKNIEVVKLITNEKLLEFLNEKINFYKKDLSSFIKSNLQKNTINHNDIFDSREKFLKYIQDLISSTYKITKVTDDSDNNENLFLNESDLISKLEMAKEYLIFGKLNTSVKILDNSVFDDYEINRWIQDAKKLEVAVNMLNLIESKLIDYIGEEFD